MPEKSTKRAKSRKSDARGLAVSSDQNTGGVITPPENPISNPLGFARIILGLDQYDWQKKVLADLTWSGSSVALRAANGSGKTQNVAAPLAIWHAAVFPRSTVVCTAGAWRQVRDQLFTRIGSFLKRLPGWEMTQESIRSPMGSRILGFSTDDAGRFEGWHGSPTEPLLMIVDEAKTVKDSIFEAVERCQPQRRLIMSSPGGMDGEFYHAFTKRAAFYRQHVIQASDCPHISPDWIAEQIAKWGIDHPLIRSMIFAEFAAGGDDYIIPLGLLDRLAANPPQPFTTGRKVAFCDFAAGGDENVLAVRDGTHIEFVSWREADTTATIGRFILEFRRRNLREENIYGDEGGLGKPICDSLRDAGWVIHRVNNGATAIDSEAYANRGSEIWYTGSKMIEECRVVLPDDSDLRAQLTGRKHKPNSRGKLQAESKEDMRKRGLPSPDRADAVLGCMVCGQMREVRSPLDTWGPDEGHLDRMEDQLAYTSGAIPPGCDAGY